MKTARCAVLLLLVVGCRGTVTGDNYPAELARAFCKYGERCDAIAFPYDTCVAELTRAYESEEAAAAEIRAPGVALDIDEARACLDSFGSAECNDSLRNPARACWRVRHGTRSNGAACLDGECALGSYCDVADVRQCGECKPSAVEGQMVTNANACAPDFIFQNGRCVALEGTLAAAGEPCAGGGCGEGLRCVQGVCLPMVKVGGACTTTQECQLFGECRTGDDGRDTCHALLRPGQPCEEGTCYASACFEKVCTEAAEDGEACSVARRCTTGLFCTQQNVCEKAHGNGEACSVSGAECDAKHTCENGSCVPFGPSCN